MKEPSDQTQLAVTGGIISAVGAVGYWVIPPTMALIGLCAGLFVTGLVIAIAASRNS